MHMMFRTDKFNKILGTPTYFADDGDDRLVFRNGDTSSPYFNIPYADDADDLRDFRNVHDTIYSST